MVLDLFVASLTIFFFSVVSKKVHVNVTAHYEHERGFLVLKLFFLMNGVDIRLKFDFCPTNILINAADESGYKYMIQTAKLWTKKIAPNPDALLSLNRSLINTNSDIEYVFGRPIIKKLCDAHESE